VTNDSFSTRNEFHGIDLGFRQQLTCIDNLSLEFLTKLAIGRLNRTFNIGGDQTISVPGVPTGNQTGRVLPLAANSVAIPHGDRKVLPEVGVTLNWAVRSNVSLRLGYSFLLLNGVARAADQIDTTINPNLFPGANPALGGPLRPAPSFAQSNVWIQSINFGVM